MMPSSTYQAAARAYADGVRDLLGLAPAPPARREVRGRRDLADLTDQAAALAPISNQLAEAAQARLDAPDPSERSWAATQLLAKALADLQVGAFLLQAAETEQAPRVPRTTKDTAAEESAFAADVEEALAILLAEEPAARRAARAIAIPADLPSARDQLTGLITAALNLIRARAAGAGQSALSGLLALGLGKVAEAASLIGMDLAQALGVADQVSRIYAVAREFALSAYNAVVAVFGPAIVQSAIQQALAWINDVAAGQQFSHLLEQLYQTQQTSAQLAQLVATSQADLSRFIVALQEVDSLQTSFQQQIGLVDKLLQGFRFFGGAAVVAIPQVTVLIAAAYLALFGYAVLAGADYADAERLKLLNRVPGVRKVVEMSLIV